MDAQVALTLRTLGRNPIPGPCRSPAARPPRSGPRRLYLIFNEGYGGRGDLAAEAIRLGRALVELMPDVPEAHGLPAMMLLLDARRGARFREGELVLLADRRVRGPQAALEIIDRLDLESYQYLPSTRGVLLHRLGRTAEARDAYSHALALVDEGPERRLLERRLAELETA